MKQSHFNGNGSPNHFQALNSGFTTHYALPWVVLLLCLAATGLFWNSSRLQTDKAFHDYFDFRVRQAVILTEQRILAQEQVLRGALGLFVSSKSVERDEFHRFVTSQRLEENYPGIQGVGFSLIVPTAAMQQHLAAIRKDSGHPEYVIWPGEPREFYTSIIYLEPFYGRNLRAFGYDMYSEPVRRAAMDNARDSGLASISGKVTLVQETDKDIQSGFLIYLPVYKHGAPQGTIQERRDNILGWVYSPLRMNDLALGMFGERSEDLDIEIYDGETKSPETLLFDSKNNHDPLKTYLSATQTLNVANHIWTLAVHSMPTMAFRFKNNTPNIVAASGVTLSLLITMLVWMLINGRSRAMAFANAMNIELTKENEKNLALLRNASDGIHILDIHGNVVEVSDSFCKMLGYSREEMLGMNFHEWDAGFQEPELTRVFKQQFTTDQRSQFETRHRRKDGSTFDVEISGARMMLGGQTLLFNSSRDITDRKKMLEALILSESEFHLLAEAVPQIVWMTRADGWNIYFNQQWVDYTGLTLEESYGHGWNKPFHPDDQQRAWDAWQDAVYNNGSYSLECRLRRHDGVYHWWLIRGSPALDEDGKVYKWFGTCTDIETIKAAEDALKASEQRYRGLLADQTEFICRFRVDGTVDYVNRAYCHYFEMDEETILGSTWHPVALKEDLPYINQQLAELTAKNPVVTIENRVIVGKSQEIRWAQFVNRGFFDAQGKLIEIQAIGRDITQRKALEAKLNASSIELEDLYEHAPCGYHSINSDGTFVRINATELEWLECSKEEVINKKKPTDFFTPASQEIFKSTFPEFLKNGLVNNLEFELIGQHGTQRYVILNATAIYDANGNFLTSRSVMHDISELKMIQAALTVSEQKFRTMANTAPVLIWIAGLDKMCHWFNQSWLIFTGRSMEQEMGNGWAEGVHPEDMQRCLDTYNDAFNARQPFSMEFRLRRYDGIYRWIIDNGTPMFDAQGQFTGYIGSCTDISERHDMEERIHKLAFYDPLTNLPNRRLLDDRLAQAMAASKRSSNYGALFFMDLDNFKPLNDVYGHNVGDLLLIEVAKRLASCVRETDTVARFGGDEFVVLLHELGSDKNDSQSQALLIGEKIRHAIADPYIFTLEHEGQTEQVVTHYCTTSMGCLIFKDQEISPEDALKLADAGMYEAKESGRNSIKIVENL